MVTMKPTVISHNERRHDRLKKFRDSKPAAVVRVEPGNEDMRRVLKHPRGNVGFLPSGNVEWPLDSFTRRRIADGSVKVVQQKAPSHQSHQSHQSHSGHTEKPKHST